jgi:hypothetical protein
MIMEAQKSLSAVCRWGLREVMVQGQMWNAAGVGSSSEPYLKIWEADTPRTEETQYSSSVRRREGKSIFDCDFCSMHVLKKLDKAKQYRVRHLLY